MRTTVRVVAATAAEIRIARSGPLGLGSQTLQYVEQDFADLGDVSCAKVSTRSPLSETYSSTAGMASCWGM